MNSTHLITIDTADNVRYRPPIYNSNGSASLGAHAAPLGTALSSEETHFEDVETEITQNKDPDPYNRVFERTQPIIHKPTSREIGAIDLLGFDLVRDNLQHDCRDKYDFDWLNLRAYAENWDCLDWETQKNIRAFLESDLRGNNLKHGMKRREEFHKHLLLLTGCEIWNIRAYANTNMMVSNLKDQFGNYSWPWTKDRWIDARDCNQAAHEFLNTYDPSELFRNFNAQIIQFEACAGYRHQPEPGWLARALFKSFFRENAAILKSWVRSDLIHSYIYSHEISCDSILGMRFRPHTHAIVFFKKSPIPPDLEARMALTDRRLTALPYIHTQYSTLEKFIRYLFGAYSLVEVYQRERKDDNLQALNKNTVQVLHAVMELPKGDKMDPGVQRNNHSYIPPKDRDAKRWIHPNLNKKKKLKAP